MNLKQIMLSLAAATAIFASAQNQGYQDGIEYFKADQFDNAKEILSNTLNAPGTDRAEALYYLGAIALHDGDAATARKNFEEGIALDPKNGLNYVGLGAIALKEGNAKAAEDYFKQATKAQNKAFVHVAIARAYYNADKVAYAKEYDKFMDNAVRKDKKEPSYYVMRGDALRDRAIAAGTDEGTALIGEAATEYNQAIYFNPKSPDAYVKYSRVYAKANPQYAIDKLKELNELMPNSAMAQRELAERYYDNKEWTKAAREYGTYIQNPNHFIKDEERYAVLLYSGDEIDRCMDIVNQGLSKDPNSQQLRRLEMLCLEHKKDYAGAKASADKYFKIPGAKFTGNDYASYANILGEMGDVDGEIAARIKATEVSPDDRDLYNALSQSNFEEGNKYLKADSLAEARRYFEPAVAAWEKFVALAPDGKPSDVDYVNLALRYQSLANACEGDSIAQKANYAKAKEAFNKAIAIDPTYYVPYQRLGRLTMLENGGKPNEETLAAFSKVIEILNANPENLTKEKNAYNEAYVRMASYYMGQKDTEKAKECYLKMLELDPENQALKDYIEKMK